MKEIKYYKLVRDNIPSIIKSNNNQVITHIADDTEYIEALFSKIMEEIEEFKQSPNEEELADILEVVYALASVYQIEMSNVIKVKDEKRKERGGFDKKIILEKVIE
ncbi:MAG TPA: nucleoside triphosphate pyrophosphohydrolase [Haloplasmataceae bacterium]